MSANHQIETITQIADRGNIGMTCRGCGRKGVVDGKKAVRWFFCQRWDTHVSRACGHFRCIECGGTATKLGLTHNLPTAEWGPRSEAEWKALVKRLRG